jgi:hypothetical protein
MDDRFPKALARFRDWVAARPYTALAALFLPVIAVQFCLRDNSEWDRVFVRTAHNLWIGEYIYHAEDAFLYPPFMAWAALPFTVLPAPLSRFLFLLINFACLAAMFRWAWRLAGGTAPEGGKLPRSEHTAAVLGALVGIPYLLNCFEHQQVDLLIGALLLGGCLLMSRTRPYAAATCWGVAAAMKCTALLWLPYLLWRGRARAAAWLLCVAFGVNLLPELVNRPASGQLWLVEFASQFLRPLAASDHYAGTWGSDILYNQSLAGAGHRWLLTTFAWTDTSCVSEPRPDPVSPLTLRIVLYGVQAALLLLTVLAVGRPFRRLEREAETGERAVLEFSAVLLLMLLLSPMSSKAHFGVLILPGFYLARAAFCSGNRAVMLCLLPSVVLGLLSNKSPMGDRLYTLTLWCGFTTWQTLLLLAGCLLLLWQGRVAPASALPLPARAESADQAA